MPTYFWTDADIDRLAKIAAEGKTRREAAYLLRRTLKGVSLKARKHKIVFVSERTLPPERRKAAFKTRRPKRRGEIKVAGHPLVKKLCHLINQNGEEVNDLLERAGLCENTISYWRSTGIAPPMASFQAVLNAMGYDLDVVPLDRQEITGILPAALGSMSPTLRELYFALKEHPSFYVTSEKLAEVIGSTPDAIKVMVSRLRSKHGLTIKSGHGIGYMLVEDQTRRSDMTADADSVTERMAPETVS